MRNALMVGWLLLAAMALQPAYVNAADIDKEGWAYLDYTNIVTEPNSKANINEIDNNPCSYGSNHHGSPCDCPKNPTDDESIICHNPFGDDNYLLEGFKSAFIDPPMFSSFTLFSATASCTSCKHVILVYNAGYVPVEGYVGFTARVGSYNDDKTEFYGVSGVKVRFSVGSGASLLDSTCETSYNGWAGVSAKASSSPSSSKDAGTFTASFSSTGDDCSCSGSKSENFTVYTVEFKEMSNEEVLVGGLSDEGLTKESYSTVMTYVTKPAIKDMGIYYSFKEGTNKGNAKFEEVVNTTDESGKATVRLRSGVRRGSVTVLAGGGYVDVEKEVKILGISSVSSTGKR